MSKRNELLNGQKSSNERLAFVLRKHKIKNLRMTSLGNSLSAGYSMVRTTKPLLLRNESLESFLKENNITLELFNYSRSQNNNDEHIFSWLVNNITETEINKLNRKDYSGGSTSLPVNGLTEELLDEYFPDVKTTDLGIQDVILKSEMNTANIVVYNGLTGTFLDNVTRDGNFFQILFSSFKKDEASIDAVLKYIQVNNREKNEQTQVYLCGVPNYLGLGITELINLRLKKLAKRYANVVYVKPIKTKFFYRYANGNHIKEETLKKFYEKYGVLPDLHLDEEEYLELNSRIIDAISENYVLVDSMIKIDREYFTYSKYLELENPELIGYHSTIKQTISKSLEEALDIIEDNKHTDFYDQLGDYLLARSPSDFYFIGKDNIKTLIKQRRIKEETLPLYKGKKY